MHRYRRQGAASTLGSWPQRPIGRETEPCGPPGGSIALLCYGFNASLATER